MDFHSGYAVTLSLSRSALQSLIHAVWVAGAIPSRFEGEDGPVPNLGKVRYSVSLGEPQVAFEPLTRWPTLHLDARGTIRADAWSTPLNLVAFASIRAPIVPVERTTHTPKGMTATPKPKRPPTEVRVGFDLRSVVFSRLEIFVGGIDVSKLPDLGDLPQQVQSKIKKALKEIPPDRFMFSPPLLKPIQDLGYVPKAYVQLSPEAATIAFDVTRSNASGVVFSTKGDPSGLQDLNRAVTPRGYRKAYVQALPQGTDEYGTPLFETGYTGSTSAPDGPHGSSAAVVVNPLFLYDLYDIAGRFSILESFEASKAKMAQDRIARLRNTPRTSAWSAGPGTTASPDGADRKFDVGSSEKVVIHNASMAIEDGQIVLRAEVTFMGDVTMSTSVRIGLRVVRLTVSGSTSFVVRHGEKEGLQVEIASVHIAEPEAVTLLEALGFAVGVALAPVTAGASLAIATLAVLIVDATVDALIGNAERQAQSSLQKAASTGLGLPLDWTSIPLVPDKPVVLDMRPVDAAIRANGVFAWFDMRTRLDAARVRPDDRSVSDIWPSTRLEPIVFVLDGADTLTHPEDSATVIEWILTVAGSTQSFPKKSGPLCPNHGPDADAIRFAVDHQSEALRGFEIFQVTCHVYRPTESGQREMFSGKASIRITDRLLRQKPYVRWSHLAFYEGFTRPVGDPFRAPKGWVRNDRNSRIHLTDPALRCKMADRYSKHLKPESLTYLDTLPFPKADLAAHRKEVCDYCFFGGPTRTSPKAGV